MGVISIREPSDKSFSMICLNENDALNPAFAAVYNALISLMRCIFSISTHFSSGKKERDVFGKLIKLGIANGNSIRSNMFSNIFGVRPNGLELYTNHYSSLVYT